MNKLATLAALSIVTATGCSTAVDEPDAFAFDVSKADGADILPIFLGGSARGAFDGREPAVFGFDGEAGDVVSAYVAAEERLAGADPILILTTPEAARYGGKPIAWADDIEPAHNLDAHIVDVTLPVSGRYLLVIADEAGVGADYRLRLSCTGGRCDHEYFTRGNPDCRLSDVGERVYHTLNEGVNPDRAPMSVGDSISFRNAVGPILLSRAPQLYGRGEGELRGWAEPPYAPDAYPEPEIFHTLADMIARARYEVDIRAANISPSEPFDEIMDGIARLESRMRIAGRHGDPALVRIIADAFEIGGSRDRVYAENLWTAIHRLDLDPELVQVQIAAHHHLTVGEDHSKIIVIDGAYVHLGGANPQANNDYDHPEHDAAYVLKGEIAQSALRDFDYSWNRDNTELWRCRFDATGRAVDCDDEPTPAPTHRDEVLTPDWDALGLPADACVPMIYLGKRGSASLFTNRTDHPIGQGILGALRASRRILRLEAPNLNDDAIIEEIVAALMRDPTVRVQIVVPPRRNERKTTLPGGGGTNEERRNQIIGDVTRALVDACADGDEAACSRDGKEASIVDRLQYRWFPIEGDVPGAQHVKYVSVDHQVVIVGSANLDTQSMNRARESSILIDDAWVTQRFDETVFLPDFVISEDDPILDDGALE